MYKVNDVVTKEELGGDVFIDEQVKNYVNELNGNVHRGWRFKTPEGQTCIVDDNNTITLIVEGEFDGYREE